MSILHVLIDKDAIKRQTFASLSNILGAIQLANSPQARKRARQAETRRLRNMSQKSTMRTAIKQTLKAVEAGDKTLAEKSYQSVISLTDKAAGKNLIHTNKAARIKSRLNQKVNAL